MKLFAVYLGGRAPKSHIELHDVVFAIGESIEDTYEQLLEQWFGSPEGLHIDSWLELDIVDGYRVGLSAVPVTSEHAALFFVNLGGYLEGRFTEVHDSVFLVAADRAQARSRAKELLLHRHLQVHVDDSLQVDDCIRISRTQDMYVTLTPTTDLSMQRPCNDYHRLPAEVIAAFKERLAVA
ncbi:DUF1543 domain-containing protein [Neisseriaceae bacterium JH1-16]|nr:DUF1543 domain-containing protein [Neisseriaceae bacterium JH1-16]